jgi:hypothetical protein
MALSLIEFRPMQKNTLRGFCTIRYGSLKIKDISLHVSNGKRWASLPSKPIIAPDGTIKRDDAGKIRYVPILEWESREASDRFTEEVLAAVTREHPHAIDA